MKSLLTTYLRDISRYRPLTPEQELTLFNQMHLGHQSARDQLICAHLLLVVNIARRYTHPGTDIMDLIQEGNIGLMHAVDMFDPARGTRLSTWAVYWIHKQIQVYLNKGHDDPLSLDQLCANETDEQPITLADTIMDCETILGDRSFPATDATLQPDNHLNDLMRYYELLSEHEKQVLQLLYGIHSGRSCNVTDVALLMGISKVRVCQLRDRALKKLRDKLISGAFPCPSVGGNMSH